MNKRIGFICVFLFCAISLAVSQSLSDYKIPYTIEMFKELTVEKGNTIQYKDGYQNDPLRPVGLVFNSDNNYWYFDPIENIVRVFDSDFNFLRKVDYKINSTTQLEERQYYYIAYSNDRIILGNKAHNTQFLTVYKENAGIIGYYQFDENDNKYFNNMCRVIIIGEYAFYFREMGIVEWLEKPLTKNEIDKKKYLEMKKSSKNLEKSFSFKVGKDVYELNNNGVLFVNGVVYTKKYQNLMNYKSKPNSKILKYNSDLVYMGENSDKIFWEYGFNLLVTDKQLNILNFLNIDVMNFQVPGIKMEKANYEGCLCYSPKLGLTIFALEMNIKIQVDGPVTDLGATYICKIISKW